MGIVGICSQTGLGNTAARTQSTVLACLPHFPPWWRQPAHSQAVSFREDCLVSGQPGDDNWEYVSAACRHYTFWQRGSLGQGNLFVIPSCCVCAIRDRYPDPYGQFTGFVPLSWPSQSVAFPHGHTRYKVHHRGIKNLWCQLSVPGAGRKEKVVCYSSSSLVFCFFFSCIICYYFYTNVLWCGTMNYFNVDSTIQISSQCQISSIKL